MSTARIIETISNSVTLETKQLDSELKEYLTDEMQDLLCLPSYEIYSLDLRKVPSDNLYLNYLRNLKLLINSGQLVNKKMKVLPDQEKMIMGREIWSKRVSETYAQNKIYSDKYQVKNKVINRIKELGYENAENIYLKCIQCIKDHTSIVVTFNACQSGLNLESGLKDFQRLNIFEKPTKGDEYLNNRDVVEKAFMDDLSDRLKKSIFDNIHARPRYGILQFVGRDKPPSNVQIGGYGRSFVVLKDITKLNCVFAAGDTFKRDNDHPWKMCTIHHSEILLLECEEVMLKAIISAVLNDAVPNTDYKGYFEAQMCGFNLLDPNIVTHIHVDRYEHELKQSDIEKIREMKISITNDYGDMYKRIWNEKYQVTQANDEEKKQNVFLKPRF